MKTVRKVRRIDEDTDNVVIKDKRQTSLFKSIQILRKIKALKFEGTRQYK